MIYLIQLGFNINCYKLHDYHYLDQIVAISSLVPNKKKTIECEFIYAIRVHI